MFLVRLLVFISVLFVLSEAKCKGDCKCTDCLGATNSRCEYFEDTCADNDGDANCDVGDTSYKCDDYVCDKDTDEDASGCADLCAAMFCSSVSYSCKNDGPLSKCFHSSTIINYKGSEFTMHDLLSGKEPECHIPHVVLSDGVTIKAGDHSLTVTPTHLIKTTKGYVRAADIAAGDTVFAADSTPLIVRSVVPLTPQDEYFGLNCLTSEVVAGGIISSVFGDYHILPAAFMAAAGRIVGVKTASYIGSGIADLFYRANRLM